MNAAEGPGRGRPHDRGLPPRGPRRDRLRDRLVTVTLRDLSVMDIPGPDGSRALAVVDRRGPAGTARAGGGARVPARFGEQSSASGHGACHDMYHLSATLCDLVLSAHQRHGGLTVILDCSADVVDPATARHLLHELRLIAEELAMPASAIRSSMKPDISGL
jgi:hypothetical protein